MRSDQYSLVPKHNIDAVTKKRKSSVYRMPDFLPLQACSWGPEMSSKFSQNVATWEIPDRLRIILLLSNSQLHVCGVEGSQIFPSQRYPTIVAKIPPIAVTIKWRSECTGR